MPPSKIMQHANVEVWAQKVRFENEAKFSARDNDGNSGNGCAITYALAESPLTVTSVAYRLLHAGRVVCIGWLQALQVLKSKTLPLNMPYNLSSFTPSRLLHTYSWSCLSIPCCLASWGEARMAPILEHPIPQIAGSHCSFLAMRSSGLSHLSVRRICSRFAILCSSTALFGFLLARLLLGFQTGLQELLDLLVLNLWWERGFHKL